MISSKIIFIPEYESLFNEIFPDEIPENIDISNLSSHCDLEELNPIDALQVAEFYSEVNSVVTTWINKCYYFICKVPNHTETYLLFSISWDDNWGVWDRIPLYAAKGLVSDHEASSVLLTEFAKENLEIEGDDSEWKRFLEGLICTD